MNEKQQTPYPLRIPNELRDWVSKRAKNNMRSMNAEFNILLTAVKGQIEKQKKDKQMT